MNDHALADKIAEHAKVAVQSGVRIPTDQARQAVELGTMRWVWAISLVLAIIAMAAIYGLVVG